MNTIKNLVLSFSIIGLLASCENLQEGTRCSNLGANSCSPGEAVESDTFASTTPLHCEVSPRSLTVPVATLIQVDLRCTGGTAPYYVDSRQGIQSFDSHFVIEGGYSSVGNKRGLVSVIDSEGNLTQVPLELSVRNQTVGCLIRRISPTGPIYVGQTATFEVSAPYAVAGTQVDFDFAGDYNSSSSTTQVPSNGTSAQVSFTYTSAGSKRPVLFVEQGTIADVCAISLEVEDF